MITSDAFDAALTSGNPRVGIFFRLSVDPVFRMWLGIGDCEAGLDAEDAGGAIYKGLGEMIGVPQFQQLVNGAADRITFSVSGVTERVIQLAGQEASEIKGVALMLGLGVFDEDWGLIDDPIWLKRLVVDFLSTERDQTGEQSMRTVSLSARTFMTGRRRPGLSFFTDRDQQLRHPGDRFCEHVARYSISAEKAWPRF